MRSTALILINSCGNTAFATSSSPGVTTDGGVQSTMRDANDRGYECLLLEDCCNAIEREHHDATLRMFKILRGHYGSIANSGTLLSVIA